MRRFKRVPTIYVSGRNKKNNVYPCKPQFYYIKVGFKGVRIIKACFRDANVFWLISDWIRKKNKVLTDLLLVYLYLDNTRRNGSHIILHLYLDKNVIRASLLISFIWGEMSKYLIYLFFLLFLSKNFKFNLLISRRILIQNLYDFKGYSFSFFFLSYP